MKVGDVVSLKNPFRPEPGKLKEYRYGIVTGLVEAATEPDNVGQLSKPGEVILYLFDPETSTIYEDEFGLRGMFYFRYEELDI